MCCVICIFVCMLCVCMYTSIHTCIHTCAWHFKVWEYIMAIHDCFVWLSWLQTRVGEIRKKGVVRPTTKDVYMPILERLKLEGIEATVTKHRTWGKRPLNWTMDWYIWTYTVYNAWSLISSWYCYCWWVFTVYVCSLYGVIACILYALVDFFK